MTAILGAIVAKFGVFGVTALGGVGLTAAFFVAKKFLPGRAGAAVAAGLRDGFQHINDIKDPVERQLVMNIAIDVVKWVEYKVPGKGQGRQKFEFAAQKLCALLPFLKGRDKDLADLIEAAVEAMDNELEKAVDKP